MITMKNLKLALVTIVAAAVFSGCTLSKMIKLAADQELTVSPNPLELHGGEVPYNMSVVLPPKMLPAGKVYTIKNFYQYGGKEIEIGSVEFKADDFPSSSTTPSRKSADFTFNFTEDMTPGKLMVMGEALDPRNGKTASTPKMEVAVGVITTSSAVKDAYLASFAGHGYNDQEELIPTNINFYFSQGSSVLSPSIKTDGTSNRDKQKDLSAFIADKNVTRTVTITGTHSPEGEERINNRLSNERAERIERYYRAQMRRYDYKGMADSIKFILKPVVEDWSALRKALTSFDGVPGPAKKQMQRIIDGSGSFEDKEKELRKVDGYKTVFDEIYPDLRAAKTEILTVKEKKTPAEIAVLAKLIVDGSANADTLSNEEFLYAATLTPSLDEKEAIYQSATKRDGSWVAHNNLAAVYLSKAMGDVDNRAKLVEDALTQLEIASKKENKPKISANMASAYMMQGEYEKAYEMLGKAESKAGNNLKSDINALKGSIEIRMAEYDKAKASLVAARNGETVQFNRGLVNLLTGDYNGAINSFSGAYDSSVGADAYYYSAVSSARGKNPSDVVKSLKEAISKDMSLKDKALNDLEFVNFADAVAQALR
jgi:tetratricopeptide (TPR) repeat protein